MSTEGKRMEIKYPYAASLFGIVILLLNIVYFRQYPYAYVMKAMWDISTILLLVEIILLGIILFNWIKDRMTR